MQTFYHKALLLVVVFFALGLSFSSGQKSTYYVGHSLINLDIPYQTQRLAEAAGVDNTYRHHINNGASIKLNWIDTLFNPNPIWTPSLGRDVEYGTNHFRALQSSYDHLVLTEAVPLLNYPLDTTVKYFTKFVDLASQPNPEVEVFIYATWEEGVFQKDEWGTKVRDLIPRWEAQKAALDSSGASGRTYIIPGNIAMLKLHEELDKGPIGSLKRVDQLFAADGIHPNFDGKYFMACLFAATLYDIDPRGLPVVKAGPYTDAMVVREDAVREALQRLAFEAACSYSLTGYTHTGCSLGTSNAQQTSSTLYPNPALDRVHLPGPGRDIEVLNTQGQVMIRVPFTDQIDVSGLPKGMYWVRWYEMVEQKVPRLNILCKL